MSWIAVGILCFIDCFKKRIRKLSPHWRFSTHSRYHVSPGKAGGRFRAHRQSQSCMPSGHQSLFTASHTRTHAIYISMKIRGKRATASKRLTRLHLQLPRKSSKAAIAPFLRGSPTSSRSRPEALQCLQLRSIPQMYTGTTPSTDLNYKFAAAQSAANLPLIGKVLERQQSCSYAYVSCFHT